MSSFSIRSGLLIRLLNNMIYNSSYRNISDVRSVSVGEQPKLVDAYLSLALSLSLPPSLLLHFLSCSLSLSFRKYFRMIRTCAIPLWTAGLGCARGSKLTNSEFLVKVMFFPAYYDRRAQPVMISLFSRAGISSVSPERIRVFPVRIYEYSRA